MIVVLPQRRQPQLLANIFATAEKLEKSGKRLAPDLEFEKSGVFILNQPVRSTFDRIVSQKGGDAMNG